MASVFSYSATSLHFPSDPKDQLNQSPRPSHHFHSAHPIPGSNSTVKLTCLLIVTIVNLLNRNAHHLFMEPAANHAARSTKKPRRFL